jgi:glycosyltransferase involved in cell wall biosynthesis
MSFKKKVLFVGSFVDKANDGSVGGQMYACKSLIDSKLSDEIDWILLDTTGKSVPPPSLFKRGIFAFKRLCSYILLIITKKPSSILIFAGSGASVYEKGIMVLIGKMFFKKITFAPRGGGLVDEIAASNFFKLYVRLIFYYSDNIICQGTYWSDYFKSILNSQSYNKLQIVSNWIDIEKYQPKEYPSSNKDNDKEISIISMGWMEKEKGVQDLFEATLLLNTKDIKIDIFFLGDGSLKNELYNRSKELNSKKNINYHFPGWIYGNDKICYLQKADIFVLSSYFEGMPNSLIEAMASKTSCISTQVGAVTDIIEHNINGFLYDPGDVIGLAKLLQTLIDSETLRLSFSTKALKKIQENNSLVNAINTFQRIL